MSAVTTWILVSDASRAYLYRGREKNQPWSLVESFEHPESREKNHELITDRPGRAQQAGTPSHFPGVAAPGKGSRSGMEPPTSPKAVEHGHFAQFLSKLLEKGLHERAYELLILVAPPHFLGLLRENLSEQIKKHIHTSVDKDYTALKAHELQERLADVWKYV